MNTKRQFLKALSVSPLLGTAGITWAGVAPEALKTELGHRFKISLNVYSFNQLLREGTVDLFDVLAFCAKHNFDAIDPTGYYFPGYPEVPTDDYINRFKRQAFLLGLDISGTGVRNNFTNPDETARQADKAMIKAWIVAAAKLGSPNLRVFAGSGSHKGFSRDQVFAWMAKDLQECCRVGEAHGVMVAVQNHNGFLATADDVDRLFEMVGSDWLGLNLDIGSYRTRDPYTEIQQNLRRAVTWQIKENVWIDGKETPTDFVNVFRIAKAAGYRGYLPLETLRADPNTQVPILLNQVRSALQQV